MTANETPLTIYRASHDSIVMGLYTTRQAAYEHCVAHELRDDPISPMAWEVDEDGVAEELGAFNLLVSADAFFRAPL